MGCPYCLWLYQDGLEANFSSVETYLESTGIETVLGDKPEPSDFEKLVVISHGPVPRKTATFTRADERARFVFGHGTEPFTIAELRDLWKTWERTPGDNPPAEHVFGLRYPIKDLNEHWEEILEFLFFGRGDVAAKRFFVGDDYVVRMFAVRVSLEAIVLQLSHGGEGGLDWRSLLAPIQEVAKGTGSDSTISDLVSQLVPTKPVAEVLRLINNTLLEVKGEHLK